MFHRLQAMASQGLCVSLSCEQCSTGGASFDFLEHFLAKALRTSAARTIRTKLCLSGMSVIFT